MVVNNPNNWHWVEKNTLPWAQTYLSSNVTALTPVEDVTIESVTVSGDCNVSQRKGKVICIYDLVVNITLKGEDIDGEVKIKEFIHDEKDYELEYQSISGDAKTKVKEYVVPEVLRVLYKFQDDLIAAHEKDIQE